MKGRLLAFEGRRDQVPRKYELTATMRVFPGFQYDSDDGL